MSDDNRRWLAICDVIRAKIQEGTLAPGSVVRRESAAPEADTEEFEQATTLLADFGILTRARNGEPRVPQPRARIVQHMGGSGKSQWAQTQAAMLARTELQHSESGTGR